MLADVGMSGLIVFPLLIIAANPDEAALAWLLIQLCRVFRCSPRVIQISKALLALLVL